MPFSFKEEDYQNSFPGEVTESVTLPTPNDPTKEMWQLTLLRLRYNAGKATWEGMETPYPCQLPGCAIQPWHTHTRFYESERAGSPAHKFIQSIKANTNIALMEAKDLLGKRFVWTEEVWPARPNPQTGVKGKDQYYYFIKSELGAAPTPDEHSEQPAELPWNAAAPANTNGATQTPQQSQAPTNGTATSPEGRPMTIEDAAVLLLPNMDGKTKPEVQRIITQDETLRTTPGFLVAFMQGRIEKMMVEQNFLQPTGPDGVYHLATG